MKLIRTFEITSDEFYDYLEAQLLEEISKTTKKNVKKSVIKSGYSYENKEPDQRLSSISMFVGRFINLQSNQLLHLFVYVMKHKKRKRG